MIKDFNVESRGGAQVESKVSTTKRILIKHLNVQSSMGQVFLLVFLCLLLLVVGLSTIGMPGSVLS